MNKEIIAFIGFSGSGKDYESDKLIHEHNFKRIGFSDGVREATFKRYNMHPSYGDEYDIWKQNVVLTEDGVPQTGRDLLIKVGEGLRNANPLIWSNTWYNTCVEKQPNRIVVNDCRFLHEASALIYFAGNYGYKFTFIYCSYNSERYVQTNDDTDTFADLFKQESHLANITNSIITLFTNAYSVNPELNT